MTRATLAEVLGPALRGNHAVAGLVCQGWEDSRAYVEAAEAEAAPVILQAGPGCRANTPMPVLGAMFRALADEASVPVVVHLDHAETPDDIARAIDEGFTSVMFDGSRLPLDENIRLTAEAARAARAAGVSCEGEVGFVGYAGGAPSDGTDPEEAGRFAAETGVDAVAVSVGNLHLQEGAGASVDRARLAAIEARVDAPLVIHGGSGLGEEGRAALARETRVCKVNVGTELRRLFGASLREALAEDPALYDRIAILERTRAPLVAAARAVIRELGPP